MQFHVNYNRVLSYFLEWEMFVFVGAFDSVVALPKCRIECKWSVPSNYWFNSLINWTMLFPQTAIWLPAYKTKSVRLASTQDFMEMKWCSHTHRHWQTLIWSDAQTERRNWYAQAFRLISNVNQNDMMWSGNLLPKNWLKHSRRACIITSERLYRKSPLFSSIYCSFETSRILAPDQPTQEITWE